MDPGLLAPLSTRDVAATVCGDLFTALGDLLRAAADHAEHAGESEASAGGRQPADARHDLDALIRAVDTRLYRLRLAGPPRRRAARAARWRPADQPAPPPSRLSRPAR